MTLGIRFLVVMGALFGAYFVHYSIKRDNKPLLLIASLFGVGAGITALILNTSAHHFLKLKDGLDPKNHATVQELLISTAIFVVIEETVKFIPLALFLWRKKYFNMLSDGVLYFGLTGLVFGAFEHLLYGLGYGDITLFVRIFLVLFLHAGLTGMVGYFYAKDRILGNRARFVPALILSAGLHYAYNMCLFLANHKGIPGLGKIGLVVAASIIATTVNCALVWLFYKSSQRDWKRLSSLETQPPHELTTTS